MIESLRILSVATEWWSRFGGLSTFNRELCRALTAAGCQVCCVVPDLEERERKDAEAAGVRVIEATRKHLDPSERLRHVKPADLDGFEPELVIGHGRVTGDAALEIAAATGARRLHFVHTSAVPLEWRKTHVPGAAPSTKAGLREQEELRLAHSADLVVAIGPRLYAYAEKLLVGLPHAPPLHTMLPGLGDVNTPARPATQLRQALVLGRLEDAEPKGLHVAAKAIAGLDRAVKLDVLVARGARPTEAAELHKRLTAEVRGRVDVCVYDWANTQLVEQDLRRADLVLMPSREEGFGLVALEAVALGTPILVSSTSGFGELLETLVPKDRVRHHVVSHRNAPDDKDLVRRWTAALDRKLGDWERAQDLGLELRQVLAVHLSWETECERLIAAVGPSSDGPDDDSDGVVARPDRASLHRARVPGRVHLTPQRSKEPLDQAEDPRPVAAEGDSAAKSDETAADGNVIPFPGMAPPPLSSLRAAYSAYVRAMATSWPFPHRAPSVADALAVQRTIDDLDSKLQCVRPQSLGLAPEVEQALNERLASISLLVAEVRARLDTQCADARLERKARRPLPVSLADEVSQVLGLLEAVAEGR